MLSTDDARNFFFPNERAPGGTGTRLPAFKKPRIVSAEDYRRLVDYVRESLVIWKKRQWRFSAEEASNLIQEILGWKSCNDVIQADPKSNDWGKDMGKEKEKSSSISQVFTKHTAIISLLRKWYKKGLGLIHVAIPSHNHQSHIIAVARYSPNLLTVIEKPSYGPPLVDA
jgi:hypothetical protein